MRSVRIALAGLLALALVGAALSDARAQRGEEKPKATNKDKIVGVWEFVKSSDPKSAPPPGTTIEFTKEGKMKLSVKIDGKEIPIPEGKYTVDGDTLSVTMTGPDGKEKTEKSKITTLTAETFIFEEDNKGKKEVIELKKKK